MAGNLKPLDVERETKPGKYADGDGLYLIVTGADAKNWSFRYWFGGKERWHGLGSFKDVSLKEARLARDAARLRVKGDRNTPGVDIVAEKRAAQVQAQAEAVAAAPPAPIRSGETARPPVVQHRIHHEAPARAQAVMKFATSRPFADPEAAARKLIEIAIRLRPCRMADLY